MPCNVDITNESDIDLTDLIDLANEFLPHAQSVMGFSEPVSVSLLSDEENSLNPLGKTGYYDPGEMAISIFVDGRHIKDILRSLSHELVHHTQNCNGMFDDIGEMSLGYAQEDDHLREMEREAYELGNLCFRDWEDEYKQKQQWTLNEGVIEDLMAKRAGRKGWSPLGINPSSLGYNYSLKNVDLKEKSQEHYNEEDPGPHWDRRPQPEGQGDDISVSGTEKKKKDDDDSDDLFETILRILNEESETKRFPDNVQGWIKWIFLHKGKEQLKKAFYSALYEDEINMNKKMNIYRKYSDIINKQGYGEDPVEPEPGPESLKVETPPESLSAEEYYGFPIDSSEAPTGTPPASITDRPDPRASPSTLPVEVDWDEDGQPAEPEEASINPEHLSTAKQVIDNWKKPIITAEELSIAVYGYSTSEIFKILEVIEGKGNLGRNNFGPIPGGDPEKKFNWYKVENIDPGIETQQAPAPDLSSGAPTRTVQLNNSQISRALKNAGFPNNASVNKGILYRTVKQVLATSPYIDIVDFKKALINSGAFPGDAAGRPDPKAISLIDELAKQLESIDKRIKFYWEEEGDGTGLSESLTLSEELQIRAAVQQAINNTKGKPHMKDKKPSNTKIKKNKKITLNEAQRMMKLAGIDPFTIDASKFEENKKANSKILTENKDLLTEECSWYSWQNFVPTNTTCSPSAFVAGGEMLGTAAYHMVTDDDEIENLISTEREQYDAGQRRLARQLASGEIEYGSDLYAGAIEDLGGNLIGDLERQSAHWELDEEGDPFWSMMGDVAGQTALNLGPLAVGKLGVVGRGGVAASRGGTAAGGAAVGGGNVIRMTPAASQLATKGSESATRFLGQTGGRGLATGTRGSTARALERGGIHSSRVMPGSRGWTGLARHATGEGAGRVTNLTRGVLSAGDLARAGIWGSMAAADMAGDREGIEIPWWDADPDTPGTQNITIGGVQGAIANQDEEALARFREEGVAAANIPAYTKAHEAGIDIPASYWSNPEARNLAFGPDLFDKRQGSDAAIAYNELVNNINCYNPSVSGFSAGQTSSKKSGGIRELGAVHRTSTNQYTPGLADGADYICGEQNILSYNSEQRADEIYLTFNDNISTSLAGRRAQFMSQTRAFTGEAFDREYIADTAFNRYATTALDTIFGEDRPRVNTSDLYQQIFESDPSTLDPAIRAAISQPGVREAFQQLASGDARFSDMGADTQSAVLMLMTMGVPREEVLVDYPELEDASVSGEVTIGGQPTGEVYETTFDQLGRVNSQSAANIVAMISPPFATITEQRREFTNQLRTYAVQSGLYQAEDLSDLDDAQILENTELLTSASEDPRYGPALRRIINTEVIGSADPSANLIESRAEEFERVEMLHRMNQLLLMKSATARELAGESRTVADLNDACSLAMSNMGLSTPESVGCIANDAAPEGVDTDGNPDTPNEPMYRPFMPEDILRPPEHASEFEQEYFTALSETELGAGFVDIMGDMVLYRDHYDVDPETGEAQPISTTQYLIDYGGVYSEGRTTAHIGHHLGFFNQGRENHEQLNSYRDIVFEFVANFTPRGDMLDPDRATAYSTSLLSSWSLDESDPENRERPWAPAPGEVDPETGIAAAPTNVVEIQGIGLVDADMVKHAGRSLYETIMMSAIGDPGAGVLGEEGIATQMEFRLNMLRRWQEAGLLPDDHDGDGVADIDIAQTALQVRTLRQGEHYTILYHNAGGDVGMIPTIGAGVMDLMGLGGPTEFRADASSQPVRRGPMASDEEMISIYDESIELHGGSGENYAAGLQTKYGDQPLFTLGSDTIPEGENIPMTSVEMALGGLDPIGNASDFISYWYNYVATEDEKVLWDGYSQVLEDQAVHGRRKDMLHGKFGDDIAATFYRGWWDPKRGADAETQRWMLQYAPELLYATESLRDARPLIGNIEGLEDMPSPAEAIVAAMWAQLPSSQTGEDITRMAQGGGTPGAPLIGSQEGEYRLVTQADGSMRRERIPAHLRGQQPETVPINDVWYGPGAESRGRRYVVVGGNPEAPDSVERYRASRAGISLEDWLANNSEAASEGNPETSSVNPRYTNTQGNVVGSLNAQTEVDSAAQAALAETFASDANMFRWEIEQGGTRDRTKFYIQDTGPQGLVIGDVVQIGFYNPHTNVINVFPGDLMASATGVRGATGGIPDSFFDSESGEWQRSLNALIEAWNLTEPPEIRFMRPEENRTGTTGQSGVPKRDLRENRNYNRIYSEDPIKQLIIEQVNKAFVGKSIRLSRTNLESVIREQIIAKLKGAK